MHLPNFVWYTIEINTELCRNAGTEMEVFAMKQFAKMLAAIIALAAGVLALCLALDKEQEEKYISIYDTDEGSKPF